MTEIHHNQLPDYLEKKAAIKGIAAYLIHGEPMLVEQCVAPLIDRLLDGASRDTNCEIADGAAENIPDVLEQMNTYAMLAGPKIVWFKDAKLFDAGGSHKRWVEQIQEAYETDDLDRAAKGFLNLCGQMGLDAPMSKQGDSIPPELQPLQSAVGDSGVQQLMAHCRSKGWTATASGDYIQALEQAIAKGFPPHHYLVITSANKVPKNRKFYKTLQSHGLIIDCHVPLGERKADKMAQDTVLRQILDTALLKAGKHMHAGLFAKLSQLTGFDPATFKGNVEKLIDFTGERTEITSADLHAVLRRTKTDPIYELTNAAAERNVVSALFYLNTLLQADFHPLQILSALANQMRKLLVAKAFVMSARGRGWRPGISYPQFQKAVMPDLQAYDNELDAQAQHWQGRSPENVSGSEKRGAKRANPELMLAPNPGNAYPVYQTLLKSENYGLQELVRVMQTLSDTDLRLKSTGQDAGLLMKHLIMTVCNAAPDRK